MNDMCDTRETIIRNSTLLQRAVKELERLQATEGNGSVRREIVEYEMLVETYIRGEQTNQDVSEIRSAIKALLAREREHLKYPSVAYQLQRLPLMGWSMLAGTLLTIWLVSRLGPGLLLEILSLAGVETSATSANVVVAVGAVVLFLNGISQYIKYLQKCEEPSGTSSAQK